MLPAPVDVARIDDARQRIIRLFEQHCEHGQQTKSLSNTHAAACGQSIGQAATTMEQRGLHGTGAAIHVLASADNSEMVNRLAYYVTHRTGLEKAAGYTAIDDKDAQDRANVIKVSEIIRGLSKAKQLSSEPQTLRQELVATLKTSFRKGCGWGFFLEDQDPNPLPTAFAYSALASAGDVCTEARQYLLDRVSADPRDNDDAMSVVQAACLYYMSFSNGSSLPPGAREQYATLFRALWRRLSPGLSEEIEQNIEYSYCRQKTCYVRVPWQLYLLALAARFDFKGAFSSCRAQERLHQIVSHLAHDRFKYPASGFALSSRTHQIAFEALTQISEELGRRKVSSLRFRMNSLRRWVGRPRPRRIMKLAAWVGIAVFVGAYVFSDRSGAFTAGFVSSLAASVLLLVANWSRGAE